MQGSTRWRDPDSNRGPHDFQGGAIAPRYRAEVPREGKGSPHAVTDLGSGTLSSCGEHQVGALMDHHVSTFQGAVAVPPFGRSFHFATRWNVRSRVQHLVVDLYELTFAHLPDNQFG